MDPKSRTSRVSLEDLDFADDIVLLAHLSPRHPKEN